MKNPSLYVVSLLAGASLMLSLAGGCGKQAPTANQKQEPNTYQNNEYAFGFQYPADWSEKANPGALVLVMGQPDSGFAPNANIVLLPFVENVLQITKEAMQADYEQLFKNVDITEFETRKIGGKDCVFVHYQGTTSQDALMEQYQFIFPHKDKTFLLTFTNLQTNFEKTRAQFDSIVDSFQFD